MKIESFAGPHRFLSNFYLCARPGIQLHYGFCGEDARYWPTVEHAFQASKTRDYEARNSVYKVEFRTLYAATERPTTPSEAKRAGRNLAIRRDWEDVKIPLMYYYLEQKFTDPMLRKMLLATEDAELIEGNWWNDTFWGVCNGAGRNELGQLLMALRQRLCVKR